MVKKKKSKIPKRFIYIDRDFGTRATRDKKTGKLTGREKVSGFGDKTAIFRVKKDHKRSGQIIGRTSPIKVRASSKKRGTTRLRRTL